MARSGEVTQTFDEVVALIRDARQRAVRTVNAGLIDLYWRIGETISQRVADDGWGQGTVTELAAYIQRSSPGVRGFSPQNLWRMRQFFEAYRGQPEISMLLRELPWSANLHILSKTKRADEREFYLEALDRDAHPPHEGPSIGLLLCATKDSEVVEYALSRAMSPTLVAEYRTRLPDRRLLQAKLHEFYQQAIGEDFGVAHETNGAGTARTARRPAEKRGGGKASRGKGRKP